MIESKSLKHWGIAWETLIVYIAIAMHFVISTNSEEEKRECHFFQQFNYSTGDRIRHLYSANERQLMPIQPRSIPIIISTTKTIKGKEGLLCKAALSSQVTSIFCCISNQPNIYDETIYGFVHPAAAGLR